MKDQHCAFCCRCHPYTQHRQTAKKKSGSTVTSTQASRVTRSRTFKELRSKTLLTTTSLRYHPKMEQRLQRPGRTPTSTNPATTFITTERKVTRHHQVESPLSPRAHVSKRVDFLPSHKWLTPFSSAATSAVSAGKTQRPRMLSDETRKHSAILDLEELLWTTTKYTEQIHAREPYEIGISK